MSDKSTPVVPPSDFDANSQLAAAPAPKASQARLRVGFLSLGCPKNLVDSEVMMGLLATSGAEITSRAEDADIIVVNTCSFIDSAKQESVDTILEMARFKRVAGPRSSLSRDVWSSAIAMRSGRTFRRLMPWSAPASSTAFWPPPRSKRQEPRRGLTFKILNSSSAQFRV